MGEKKNKKYLNVYLNFYLYWYFIKKYARIKHTEYHTKLQ